MNRVKHTASEKRTIDKAWSELYHLSSRRGLDSWLEDIYKRERRERSNQYTTIALVVDAVADGSGTLAGVAYYAPDLIHAAAIGRRIYDDCNREQWQHNPEWSGPESNVDRMLMGNRKPAWRSFKRAARKARAANSEAVRRALAAL